MIHRVGYVGAAVWALILVLFAFMAVVPVALLGAKGYWITFAYMAVYAYWAHRTKVLYGLKLWPTRDSKDE